MITWAERAKAVISQKGQNGTVKTDEIAALILLTVSAVATEAVSAMPEGLSSVLAVPSPAVMEKHDSSIAVPQDPDRWCWPHSSAMNGAEINTFLRRLQQFTGKGLARSDAEALADKLVLRDRESDDRRVCMECKNFSGYGAGSWRCGNWLNAWVATQARDAALSANWVNQLQHCDGFILQSVGQGLCCKAGKGLLLPNEDNERIGGVV